ncbi:hypothetical protein AAZX31_08G155500 [Glycine max]
MEASIMLPLERTSSIEREPMTLNINQIQSARELAIYILNTKTIEEASRIFTEVDTSVPLFSIFSTIFGCCYSMEYDCRTIYYVINTREDGGSCIVYTNN